MSSNTYKTVMTASHGEVIELNLSTCPVWAVRVRTCLRADGLLSHIGPGYKPCPEYDEAAIKTWECNNARAFSFIQSICSYEAMNHITCCCTANAAWEDLSSDWDDIGL
jgi:hypothetical protein